MRTIQLLTLLVIAACAAPTTHQSALGRDQLRLERLRQQQFVIQGELAAQERVNRVAWPLLKAAVPLCDGQLGTRLGLTFSNVQGFSNEYQEAARSLGFTDTLSITSVLPGSPADRAGFMTGDRLVDWGDRVLPVGRGAAATLVQWLSAGAPPPERAGGRTAANTQQQGVARGLTVRRPIDNALGERIELRLLPDTVCNYPVGVMKSQELNAWTDGRNIAVTTAMLRFIADDDELGAVLAHEIAHNVMRHIEAKKKNAALGALFGAIVDVAAATQGVNTGGEFTNMGAQYGAMTFSQDFEREADYVGQYILARAGMTLEAGTRMWRRMAQESPGSIRFATSHPTTVERFLRLEQAAEEIIAKTAAGEELTPTRKQEAAGRRRNEE
jgi:beta-barrel assembly-enhancing protease